MLWNKQGVSSVRGYRQIMSKNKEVTGHIQWARMLKKLNPYTIRKGLRYFKHYGPKEFWVRLHERFEPEEVPYGPWYEAYIPDDTQVTIATCKSQVSSIYSQALGAGCRGQCWRNPADGTL